MEDSPSHKFKRKQIVETTIIDDNTKNSQKVKIVDAIEITSNSPVMQKHSAITPLTNDFITKSSQIFTNLKFTSACDTDVIISENKQLATSPAITISNNNNITLPITTIPTVTAIAIAVCKIIDQPDRVQVANYNVQPLITIEFFKILKYESTLSVELIEHSTGTIIYKGFKAGDSQVLASDSRQVSFYGLKLNRLGHLRNQLDLSKFDSKGKEVSYRLSIKMDGEELIKSDPFTLVSSFTQLPEDLKEKRQQRTGRKFN